MNAASGRPPPGHSAYRLPPGGMARVENRRHYQGPQCCPQRPVSFVMAVM